MIDVMTRRRLFAFLLAPLALAPLAGCGYALAGRGSALHGGLAGHAHPIRRPNRVSQD